jgi:hypothetical protein
MPEGATSKLKIIRHGGYADRFRSYKIFVNDQHVGDVARNSVLDFEVPSGAVKVQARIDWGRSRPLDLNASPNQTIELEVSNHWGPLLGLWGATFGAGSYLLLKQFSHA